MINATGFYVKSNPKDLIRLVVWCTKWELYIKQFINKSVVVEHTEVPLRKKKLFIKHIK